MSGIGKRLSDFRQNQAIKYNEVDPNTIPSRGINNLAGGLRGLGGAINHYDPSGRRIINDHPNMDKYFVAANSVTPDIQAQLDMCSKSDLNNLIETQDPRAPTCGWLYRGPPTDNSPYPRYSKGVLITAGNVPPPPIFNRPAGTQLFTDLRLAKKTIEADTCRALRSCDGVESEPYRGTCGFSTWKGYGIPINPDGTAKYTDDRLFTPAAQIVTAASKCPVTEVEDEGDEGDVQGNVCKQLPNKSLSRGCLLQQIRNSGCSDKGSLYQALATGQNPTNYASKLEGMRAYSEYQRRTMMAGLPILSESLIKSGSGTQADAMNTFSHLYEAAINQSEKTAVGSAARDLCLTAGELDQFDFCSELVDSTPMIGVELDCIQKEWRRRGGTPNGEWYPKSIQANISTLFPKWGDYRKVLDSIFADMDSTDMTKKAEAFKRTMGVKLLNENNIVPSVQGKFGKCRMTTEIGVDRAGGQDIQVINTGSYEDCQRACCDNPRCDAFTHVKDGNSGMCFLKRYPTKAVPHWLGEKLTSGYKYQ
jgi:hypothetical protein